MIQYLNGELPDIISFTDFLRWNYTLDYGQYIRRLHKRGQLPLCWGVPHPDEKEKSKPFKLDSDWSYSTRIMGQTILGKITASAETADTDDAPDDKTESPKPAEEGLTVNMPVIGMDGKTKDGSMPYEILKQQLAFLK